MTDAGYTHFTFLADRSGSMAEPSERGSLASKAAVASAGVSDFIAEQSAQPGRTTWSLLQFDRPPGLDTVPGHSGVEVVSWFSEKPPSWTCSPRGATPLLDALADAIHRTGDHLASLPEDQRPGRVYVVVATDGLKNASREHAGAKGKAVLQALVKEHTELWKWEFVFIGADIDAFAAGVDMGIAAASTVGTNSVMPGAMAASYAATSSAVTRSRVTGQSVSYSDAERKWSEQGDAAKPSGE